MTYNIIKFNIFILTLFLKYKIGSIIYININCKYFFLKLNILYLVNFFFHILHFTLLYSKINILLPNLVKN